MKKKKLTGAAKPAAKSRGDIKAPAAAFNGRFLKEPDKITDAATGRTKLMDAVLSGDTAQAERLLQSGASINKANKEGKTALHYAARLGHIEMIQLLAGYNAQMNPRDKNLRTPLQDALDAPQALRVIGALVKLGADANIPDNTGRLPLHHAAASAQNGVVKKLLKHTDNPNTPDKKYAQPLHLSLIHI